MSQEQVLVGLNARLFPGNWRPVKQEIYFAAENSFKSIQLPGPEFGLDAERLGADLTTVAKALRDAGVSPVMEMLIRVDAAGYTTSGRTPLDVFKSNLAAIEALGCTAVHQHLAPLDPLPRNILKRVERLVLPQFAEAVALAKKAGFRFGFEHNEPLIGLFSDPQTCKQTLDAIPGLGLTWDLNHTIPEHLAGFQALATRIQMLHVADTPLPTVNYHLPLGLGTVDFAAYLRPLLEAGFSGAAILEIGGLPQSGGYGRDTDRALLDSRERLEAAISAAQPVH